MKTKLEEEKEEGSNLAKSRVPQESDKVIAGQ